MSKQDRDNLKSVAPVVLLTYQVKLSDGLVYGITNGDGSGYNRKNGVQLNTKSKVEGAITNKEYRSPEAKTST